VTLQARHVGTRSRSGVKGRPVALAKPGSLLTRPDTPSRESGPFSVAPSALYTAETAIAVCHARAVGGLTMIRPRRPGRTRQIADRVWAKGRDMRNAPLRCAFASIAHLRPVSRPSVELQIGVAQSGTAAQRIKGGPSKAGQLHKGEITRNDRHQAARAIMGPQRLLVTIRCRCGDLGQLGTRNIGFTTGCGSRL